MTIKSQCSDFPTAAKVKEEIFTEIFSAAVEIFTDSTLELSYK